MGESLRNFITVMKALTDPRRIRIVKLLQQRSHYVGELQAALGISQSATSGHLKQLENAGLVDFRKEGLHVHYFLADGHTNPYVATLLGNLRHWLNDQVEGERVTGIHFRNQRIKENGNEPEARSY